MRIQTETIPVVKIVSYDPAKSTWFSWKSAGLISTQTA